MASCHRVLLAKASKLSAHCGLLKLTPRQRAELSDILCDREEPGKYVETQYYCNRLLRSTQRKSDHSRFWILLCSPFGALNRAFDRTPRSACRASSETMQDQWTRITKKKWRRSARRNREEGYTPSRSRAAGTWAHNSERSQSTCAGNFWRQQYNHYRSDIYRASAQSHEESSQNSSEIVSG